jgi:hypothetical protein
MVDPDDSYQEFSNYTRRRKRRRNTLTRRILGPLILLLAVSGAAWLLLGINRVPPPPPEPVIVEPLPPEPEPIVVLPQLTIWEQIQIENPTRGIVTGASVNIRQSNVATGPVVTRLSAGARGDVIEQRLGSGQHPGPWFNIRFDGRTGWIYGQFFQPLDGRPATLPRDTRMNCSTLSARAEWNWPIS